MSSLIMKSLGSIVSIITRIFSFRRGRYVSNPRTTTHISYFRMSRKRPLSLQTVELKVRMCCTGCVKIVRNAISKLRVEVDRELGRVRVVGYVDRNKVLKAVRRAGKRAEFWPYPEPPLYFTSTQNYFVDPSKEFKESYNYYRHGYNGTEQHGNIPVGSRGDDRVSNMFNDDNVNACRLM
ncbi:heavy metal-associated isoprenylated plant protein 44 isoform X2 [Arabidopsis lyrata subsp. lyrata]|uniref:heavy metal-associated isoprenylated plant protein 44 isoform X2 n=1 Tax=Arabidopsis lyrata subsp. lyrata TaxID=81972 RepID=UPI000A29D702|nr:heavy metal-associated isoprenylated plant protein 44 isoform X2 [Arabidopsis lyrata subsp. lyrata]|eukprot:XP_020878804.1 heavy metal-associated isoprenylated plant protein 44 isoform X2 [Arabidopsis lyrata subsp. lyrata]